jgi:hypothetical protein
MLAHLAVEPLDSAMDELRLRGLDVHAEYPIPIRNWKVARTKDKIQRMLWHER